jgi:membrane protein implicated in regulation of membrane protease activity
MSLAEFVIIKAPSIACWALAVVFAADAVSNYLFAIVSVVLLLFGIYFYREESKRAEEKTMREKEERKQAEQVKEVKNVVREIWKKYF